MLLHILTLFNTEIGSVDKDCKKEQVPYWVLDQIAHLGVAVSAAFSLATCSQSKQLTSPTVLVKVFVPSVYCLSDLLSYGVV